MTNNAFHNQNNKLSQNEFRKWVLLNHGSLQLLQIAYTKHMKYISHIHKKGILHTYKIGILRSRYYVLAHKCLYIFKNENDYLPIDVVFIFRWYVNNFDQYGDYGMHLKPPYNDNIEYILYCSSDQNRNEWIQKLKVATCNISIATHYKIGKRVNKGQFSVIHSVIDKKSGKEYAIKIINKKCIDSRERMCLINEINVLKLVSHPNIIEMKHSYFDKENIYIIMKLMRFGDFFDRWKKRRRFDECIARCIMFKLFDVTKYLHSLGIVHRDLKPENILCFDEIDDTKIVISNFGLSKFTAP
eukprot:333950_1